MRTAAQRDQKGAVAVFVAGMLALLLLALALVVDLGMQRVARRDMQAVADVVAIDMARELRSRPVREVLGPDAAGAAAWRAAFADVVGRNRDSIGAEAAFTFQLGQYADGAFVELTPPIAYADSSYPYPTTSGEAVPNAVRVVAQTDVQYLVATGTGSASRSALAVKTDPTACFKTGTYLAGLNSGRSWLLAPIVEGLLGGRIDLRAVNYSGLANADLSLLDLLEARNLSVADYDGLLTTELTVAGFIDLVADALDKRHLAAVGVDAQATLVAIQIVDQFYEAALAAEAAATVPSGARITLGELLGVGTGGAAALGAQFDVLDLLMGGLVLAGNDPVTSNPVALALPASANVFGLLDVEAVLRAIQPPQTACGSFGTAAESSQIGLDLSVGLGTLLSRPIDLGVLTAAVQAPGGKVLDLELDVAQTTATLARISCAPSSIGLNLAGGAVTASATVPLQLKATVGLNSLLDTLGVSALKNSIVNRLGLLGGLLGGVVDLVTGLGTVSVTVDTEVRIDLPSSPYGAEAGEDLELPRRYDEPLNVTAGLNLSSLQVSAANTRVTVAAGKLNAAEQAALRLELEADLNLGAAFTTLLRPTLGSLDALVNQTLSPMLGLSIMGADLSGVPTPVCDGLALRG